MAPLKSFLDSIPLCIDASAAINLNATLVAEPILAALPSRVLITRSALGELGVCRRTGRDDAALTTNLVGKGTIAVAVLEDDAEAAFLRLTVGAAADTLDDGEAATLAHAVAVGAVAVIDERKATLLSARLFPGLRVASTLDLLAHQTVETQLGRTALADAVFAALQGARMRVPALHLPWVEATIGAKRMAECESIPLDVRERLRKKVGEE